MDVRGEPPPTITWFHVDTEVKSEGNIEIINVDYNTKITISNSVRKNTGVYRIKAVNEHGSDEAEVEVTVLCKLIEIFNTTLYMNCVYYIFQHLLVSLKVLSRPQMSPRADANSSGRNQTTMVANQLLVT